MNPHMPTPIGINPIKKSPTIIPMQYRKTSTQKNGEPSSVGGWKAIGSEVGNESNPTLAWLRNQVRGRKTRI